MAESRALSRVAVVGVPVVDLLGYVELFPEAGGTSPGAALYIAPGAPAVNVATGVARLGHSSVLLGRIGTDPLGIYLRDALSAEGVAVPGDLLTPSAPTASVLMLYDDDGRGEMRSFAFRRGSADSALGPNDITPDRFEGVRALFVDGILALEEQLTQAGEHAASLAHELGIRVFCDPNLRVPEDTLPDEIGARLDRLISASDEVLLNRREAGMITKWSGAGAAAGEGTPAAVDALSKRYRAVETWVIKQGARGCSVFSGAMGFVQPAFAVTVSDTSGAGDSFDAAWIVCHIEGKAKQEAAKFASAAAAITVSGKGAWRSLPMRADVECFLGGTPG